MAESVKVWHKRESNKVTRFKPVGYLGLDFREQIFFQCVATTLETQKLLNGEIQHFNFKRKKQHNENYP